MRIPARKPMPAIQLKWRRYHPNGMSCRPITTTPAADPMISILPPTPPVYASSSQNVPSIPYNSTPDPEVITSYIPIHPATRGTLSTTAERKPIAVVTMYGLPYETRPRKFPAAFSTPTSERTATVVSMPRKNSQNKHHTHKRREACHKTEDGNENQSFYSYAEYFQALSGDLERAFCNWLFFSLKSAFREATDYESRDDDGYERRPRLCWH